MKECGLSRSRSCARRFGPMFNAVAGWVHRFRRTPSARRTGRACANTIDQSPGHVVSYRLGGLFSFPEERNDGLVVVRCGAEFWMNRPLVIAALIVWTVAALAHGGTLAKSMSALPSEVTASIQEKRKACEPAHEEIKAGFITRQDVNGDHVADYILDYGKFICGVDQSFFCGTAGCLTEVFASLPDGTLKQVLSENVRELRFARIKRRPAMILDHHGSNCGKVGAARCDKTLYWNGREFTSAH